MKEQKAARIARLRTAISEADSLTEDGREAILSIDYFEFPHVITAHRGHDASTKLESLEEARRQFELSGRDLFDLVGQFHAFSNRPEFHLRRGAAKLAELVDRVRKELLTFSTLAHSIQDHCRRVQRAWDAPDFKEKISEFFGEDRLHEFVIALRNALHHVRIFRADWKLEWSQSGAKSAGFTLDKADLLNDYKEWGRGGDFLTAQFDEIDLLEIVTEYSQRLRDFYGWYIPWCSENLPLRVAEYRQLKLQKVQLSIRSHWKWLLQEFVKRKIDPLLHLDKYLTDEEMVEANKLPARSPALADYVIAKVDENGACNDEIRRLVYELFGIPSAR